MGLQELASSYPRSKAFWQNGDRQPCTLVEVPTAAGHLSDADQIAVVRHVKPLEPKGVRESQDRRSNTP